MDGNTTSINISISDKTISYTRYSYDQSGNCITKEYALNELTLLPTAKTEYSYDGLNQLIQSSHTNTGLNKVIREAFSYDKAGNRIQRSIHSAGEVKTDYYSYGLLNELNSITQKESNQSTNFSYDTDGNMRSNGRGIYCYNEYQQMTEAKIKDGNKMVCRYDAEGLRYEMEENENLIQFIYNGRDVIYEESEQASSVRYIRGNGRIIASDVEYARTYYHYASDDLGSITHLICMNEESVKESTNVDSGRIVACYDYDAFGNRIYEREEVSNRYGFTGEIYDRISGQYYLRARYYCPEIGRFTQPDSYHGDGLNLYAYVGNNPVRYVDQSGHTKCGKNNGVESGNKGAGVGKYQKAGIWERLTKRKANIGELNANPLDDFSNPRIGPRNSTVSKYIKEINQTGKLSNLIEVQKLTSSGYEIVNGHHRYLAAKKVGLEKVPIKIKNYSN